jgi:hypothetical protein
MKGKRPDNDIDYADWCIQQHGAPFDAVLPITPQEWVEQLEEDLITLFSSNICDISITITIKGKS